MLKTVVKLRPALRLQALQPRVVGVRHFCQLGTSGTSRSDTPVGEALLAPEGAHSLRDLHAKMKDLKEELNKVENQIRYYQDDSKKKILFLGAGLSAGAALEYLLSHAEKENWIIHVGDQNVELARQKTAGSVFAVPFEFDVNNAEQRDKEVSESDIVISLLPAALHILVAHDALKHKKDLLTASYVSEEMKALDQKAKDSGVLFLNEIGLDPGIDHMSCIKVVNEIIDGDGDVREFESFCGGLIAPESDSNPWGYKFTWNPRNVVLAGQGPSKFVQMGQYKYIPYHRLFSRTEILEVHDNEGRKMEFEGYANRDSLKYRSLYKLDHIPTFFRGTLRKVGFCKAWDIFVQLGLTDDSYIIEDSEHMTFRQFINSSLMYRKNDSVELKLCYHLGISMDGPEMIALRWLGIFEDTKIGLKRATPAQILQSLLERKWKMRPEDKDMIVMYNKFIYNDTLGRTWKHVSSLVVKGENKQKTAMGKTVGLPLAIAARLVLRGQISLTGVHVPIVKEIYEPVLAELAQNGIMFQHSVVPHTSKE